MTLKVARIHSSAFDAGTNSKSVYEPADIIVYLTNNDTYFAPFFPYPTIQQIKKKNYESGLNLHGLYFWSKNMVIVEDCKPETVKRVIHHLIEEGEFEFAFQKL
ncbi:MAG: hypothetical protein AAF587_33005 [Bacteroidota bacterium]